MREAQVHLNGALLPLSRARISPFDAGFQYGDGAFETILAVDGRPLFLADHIERLNCALAHLGIEQRLEDRDARSAIEETLAANDCGAGDARVKIIVTRGDDEAADGGTVCITALPYQRRDAGQVFSYMCSIVHAPHPLAEWKTLNYLPHRLASKEAERRNCDDALLVLVNGSIMEGSRTSVLMHDGSAWIVPPREGRLGGITLRRCAQLLEGAGETILERTLVLDELPRCSSMLALNSLILVQDVHRVGDIVVPMDRPGESARLRAMLLELGTA